MRIHSLFLRINVVDCWFTVSSLSSLFSRKYALVNKTIKFSVLISPTIKPQESHTAEVAAAVQEEVKTQFKHTWFLFFRICAWSTSTSAGLISCCSHCPCQQAAVWVGLDLQVSDCWLCSSAVRWYRLVSGALCPSFNTVRVSSLLSSDPHGRKVQRSTLQTHSRWTDTTRWAVIGQKSDVALVSPQLGLCVSAQSSINEGWIFFSWMTTKNWSGMILMSPLWQFVCQHLMCFWGIYRQGNGWAFIFFIALCCR